MIAQAVAAVSAATGLRFVLDGPTTEAPSNDREPYQRARYGDRWAPVLIAWATADEVPDFGVDIAGEAGPHGVRRRNGQRTYLTGAVYLDAAKAAAWQRHGNAGITRIVVEQSSATSSGWHT